MKQTNQYSRKPPLLPRLINTLLTILLLTLALALILCRWNLLPYQGKAVLTTSMGQAMPANSLIIIAKEEPASLVTGEIITYRKNGDNVTHRIVAIEVDQGTYRFQTKGDSNRQPDSEWVHPEEIQGTVKLCIPHLGKFMRILQTMAGKVAVLLTLIQILLLEIFIKLLFEEERIYENIAET